MRPTRRMLPLLGYLIGTAFLLVAGCFLFSWGIFCFLWGVADRRVVREAILWGVGFVFFSGVFPLLAAMLGRRAQRIFPYLAPRILLCWFGRIYAALLVFWAIVAGVAALTAES